MHDRHDLTDDEWARLEPLLPDRTPCRGGRWADHRPVINGVLWRTRTGSPWRDLPAAYGNWKTVYSRHRRWSGDGTWEQVLDGCGQDATWTRVRSGRSGSTRPWLAGTRTPQAPGTRRPPTSSRGGWRRCSPSPNQHPGRRRSCRPPRTRRVTQGAGSNDKNPATRRADREALGRSRGGLSTKIHLLADSRCRPLARVVTAGQRHDSLAFEPLMGRLRIRRLGRGRPRTRPARLLGDKAYSNQAIRSHLRRRRITATIPQKSDQQNTRAAKGSAGGRPPTFDAEAYKGRNTAERAFNKLKTFRAVALRTDKREFVFQGTIDVASIKIWLRDPVDQDP